MINCLAFALNLCGQQLTIEDLLLEPSALLKSELGAGGNAVYQKVEGDANILTINQVQQLAKQKNLVRTLQKGNKNEAYIEQLGAGNQLVLIQNGAGNIYKVLQQGVDNVSLVIQDGTDNIITQELRNANGVYSEFRQTGNGNEIIHITEGFVDQKFIIKQNGNGLKAKVIQSN